MNSRKIVEAYGTKMTEVQSKKVDQIKAYCIEHDMHKGSPKYEFKNFEVDSLNPETGIALLDIYIVTGLIGDEGTSAEALCRKTRHIFLSPNGAMKARGLNPVTHTWKDHRGWDKVMTSGYYI